MLLFPFILFRYNQYQRKKVNTLLENLKQKFPTALSSKKDIHDISPYIWFEDPFGSTLGILRTEITDEEVGLLELLFESPLPQTQYTMRPHTPWVDFIFETNATLPLTSWENVRFIHFNLAHSDFSHSHFEEAFLSFVPSESVLIWENETAGILIESDTDELLSKKELVAITSTLESDFYVKIRIFTGRFHPVNPELHYHQKQEQKCFNLAIMHLPVFKVTDLPDIIPCALTNGCIDTDKAWYINELLGKTRQDPELIKTIKTYIECNSNATLAAKKLYIHRNSLQYRIDKFMDKTGLDIRNFPHALAAYMVLLLQDT
jgi:hypothetical protein